MWSDLLAEKISRAAAFMIGQRRGGREIVREPGASYGNFLLKLRDLSSDVYYMLPKRKNMLAIWQPARSKMAAIFQNGHFFLSVLFEEVLEWPNFLT